MFPRFSNYLSKTKQLLEFICQSVLISFRFNSSLAFRAAFLYFFATANIHFESVEKEFWQDAVMTAAGVGGKGKKWSGCVET